MLSCCCRQRRAARSLGRPPICSRPDGGRSYGLAVGATDVDGNLAVFSNSGKHLSLVAPGDFDGPAPACSSRCPRTNASRQHCYPTWTGAGGARYGYVAGTSFSAPEVAGVAALIWAARPELKNYQVADIIKQSAAAPRAPAGRRDGLRRARRRRGARAGPQPLGRPVGADPIGGRRAVLGRRRRFAPVAAKREPDDYLRPDRRTGRPPIRISSSTRRRRPACPSSTRRPSNSTVHGNLVHMTGTGLCAITAFQPGSADFSPGADPREQVVRDHRRE